MPVARDLEERFWEKVDKSAGPDACWPWTASVNHKGYGQISLGRGTLKASRLSWEFANGPLPEDQWVLHRCDNPPCVNPAHLYAGKSIDNIRDMVIRGRSTRSAKAEAHKHDIVRWRDEGMTRRQIATALSLPISVIARAERRAREGSVSP